MAKILSLLPEAVGQAALRQQVLAQPSLQAVLDNLALPPKAAVAAAVLEQVPLAILQPLGLMVAQRQPVALLVETEVMWVERLKRRAFLVVRPAAVAAAGLQVDLNNLVVMAVLVRLSSLTL